jgi:hypothetical protein
VAANIEEDPMPRISPLQFVKEHYGSKDELVAKVAELVEPRDGESKDELKVRLRNAANATLLHLVEVGEKVKELGGRDAIVKRIQDLKGQAKDHYLADKLKAYSFGRLLDTLRSVERRVAGKAKKPPKRQRKKKG